MSTNQQPLQTRLMLKNPDASKEEYGLFCNEMIRRRFSRLLHQYDHEGSPAPLPSPPDTLPAELEITFLLDCGHPALFLHNILDHLDRNHKVIPPALLPGILSWLSSHPDLWIRIYRQHPDLSMALSRSREAWNYLIRAFDPQLELQIGSPGYYEALEGRIHMLPLRTAKYIRSIFDKANPQQQARLIGILARDDSPENAELITAQIHHSRKPVRQAALAYCLHQKTTSIYDPLRTALIDHLTTSDRGQEYTGPDDLPIEWKDLAMLADQVSKVDILTAITDPDDYLEWGKRFEGTLQRSAVVQAAIFHRSQKSLYALARKEPGLIRDPSFQAALEPDSAKALLRHLTQSPGFVIDEATIMLLKRAHRFLDEEDSNRIWKKFVEQWGHLPFTLEDLDLEILALRIHPNEIRSVWEHPILQESVEVLQKFRKILKNRLSFLKKCYG